MYSWTIFTTLDSEYFMIIIFLPYNCYMHIPKLLPIYKFLLLKFRNEVMYGDIKQTSQCNDSPYFRARPHFCGLQNNGF